MAHSYSSEYLLRKAIKAARARARPAGWEKMGMDERASAIYREKCSRGQVLKEYESWRKELR